MVDARAVTVVLVCTWPISRSKTTTVTVHYAHCIIVTDNAFVLFMRNHLILVTHREDSNVWKAPRNLFQRMRKLDFEQRVAICLNYLFVATLNSFVLMNILLYEALPLTTRFISPINLALS